METKSVTILVATVNRPHYLRNALSSIREQTALSQIAEVLVSENGGNRDSARLVREFPELPIRYIYRDPPTTGLEHGKFLYQQPTSELTAILHDDDWWMPEHLANGLHALGSRKSAIAFFSSFYEISDEAGIMASGTWHFLWWFGANYPKLNSIWELDFSEMAAAAFLTTPGHYSSLIAYSKNLKSAMRIVCEIGNPFDTDRMLAVALASDGTVLYQPWADVCVRRHSSQDSNNYNWERVVQHVVPTTKWIVEKCEEEKIDIQAILAERVTSCPLEARFRLNSFLNNPWCVPWGRKIISRFPEITGLVPDSWTVNWFSRIQKFLSLLLPPIFTRIFTSSRTKALVGLLSISKNR